MTFNPLRVLVIEDDPPKLEQLLAFLTSLELPLEVSVAKSMNSAAVHLDKTTFDFVLLDMALPTFDEGRSAYSGGRQQDLGGRDLLSYMFEMEMSGKVVLITQFPEFKDGDQTVDLAKIHAELTREFKSLYCGYLHFQHANDSWKDQLRHYFRKAPQ